MSLTSIIQQQACICLACLLLAPALNAEPPTEPAFQEIKDNPGLPRVLLIGDSVSIGYTLAVREQLKGKANVHRPPANCGSTKIGLRDLDKWIGGVKWDVIHFNFGLHDLAYRWPDDKSQNAAGVYATQSNGGHPNVDIKSYETNLRELVNRLKKTGARLIFATTTPVSADLHSYIKNSEIPYNQVAMRVMSEEGVPIDDLWSFAKPQIDAIQIPGNPHFTSAGSKVLASQVASHIEAELPVSKN